MHRDRCEHSERHLDLGLGFRNGVAKYQAARGESESQCGECEAETAGTSTDDDAIALVVESARSVGKARRRKRCGVSRDRDFASLERHRSWFRSAIPARQHWSATMQQAC